METTAKAGDQVLITRDGPIVTLTFNRPEARNAMTWEMYQRLYDTCEEVDNDDSIRVLVLKGAGGKAYLSVDGTEGAKRGATVADLENDGTAVLSGLVDDETYVLWIPSVELGAVALFVVPSARVLIYWE